MAHERPDRSELGTTLIELMMGLVVLMVVTLIALPMTASFYRDANLRSAAEDIIYAGNLARSRARSNRRAYGVSVTLGDDGLKVDVIRGTSGACSSLADAGATNVYSSDYRKNNPKGNPVIAVVASAPADLTDPTAFPCFKPDGRVLRADSATPFSAPSGTSFQAGDVFYELMRVTSDGTKIGNRLQVQFSYSGNARLTFGYKLAALQ